MIQPRTSLFLALVGLATAASAQRPGSELVVSGDGIVAATVNGVPGRIRVDPATPALPLLSTRWANQARLRPGMFGFGYMVGPEQVDGVSAVARIAVGPGSQARKRRVGWTRLPYSAAADGVIGPGGVPQQVVRFVLRPARPGERVISLPLVNEGGLFGGWGGMYALAEVGGEPMRIRIDPHSPQTLATAGAGVRLAHHFDGRLAGDSSMVPIAFGLARPVRRLNLAIPAQIGPFAITQLGVRTADFGNTSSIRDEASDPDEIVVTGGVRARKRDRITIGADLLSRCSSIVYDKRANRLRLSCV